MRTIICALLVVTALGTSTAVRAEDDNGYSQIKQGDYAKAERLLVTQHKLYPGDTDLTINLAAVYARAGRLAEARALYADVLRRPQEVLDRDDGTAVYSHDLARAGVVRLEKLQVTSR